MDTAHGQRVLSFRAVNRNPHHLFIIIKFIEGEHVRDALQYPEGLRLELLLHV
jgi:hypothetical protein